MAIGKGQLIVMGALGLAAAGAFYLYWQCRNQPVQEPQPVHALNPPPTQSQWYRPDLRQR